MKASLSLALSMLCVSLSQRHREAWGINHTTVSWHTQNHTSATAPALFFTVTHSVSSMTSKVEQHTRAHNTTSNTTASALSNAPKTTVVPSPASGQDSLWMTLPLVGLLMFLILLLVVTFKCAISHADEGSRAHRTLNTLREQLRNAMTSFESCLGFQLCPPRKRVEEEEEMEGRDKKEAQMEAGVGGARAHETGEGKEDTDETSSDYSDLDLREKVQRKTKGEDERGGEGDGGQRERDGTEEGEEDRLSSIALEERNEAGDVTAF